MKYRCVNDIKNYCKDKPEWKKRPNRAETREGIEMIYEVMGKCRNDPKTCPNHLKWSDMKFPEIKPSVKFTMKK